MTTLCFVPRIFVQASCLTQEIKFNSAEEPNLYWSHYSRSFYLCFQMGLGKHEDEDRVELLNLNLLPLTIESDME